MIKFFNIGIPLIINGIYFDKREGVIILNKEYEGVKEIKFLIYGIGSACASLHMSHKSSSLGFSNNYCYYAHSVTLGSDKARHNKRILEFFKKIDINIEDSIGLGIINSEDKYYSAELANYHFLKENLSGLVGGLAYTDTIKSAYIIGKLIPVKINQNSEAFLRTNIFHDCDYSPSFDTTPNMLFLCRYHADCCGTTILNAFNEDLIQKIKRKNIDLYDLIEKNLTENFNKQEPGHQYLAHLPTYKNHSINLLKKIGFEIIQSFINGNSGNTIHTMSFVSP